MISFLFFREKKVVLSILRCSSCLNQSQAQAHCSSQMGSAHCEESSWEQEMRRSPGQAGRSGSSSLPQRWGRVGTLRHWHPAGPAPCGTGTLRHRHRGRLCWCPCEGAPWNRVPSVGRSPRAARGCAQTVVRCSAPCHRHRFLKLGLIEVGSYHVSAGASLCSSVAAIICLFQSWANYRTSEALALSVLLS